MIVSRAQATALALLAGMADEGIIEVQRAKEGGLTVTMDPRDRRWVAAYVVHRDGRTYTERTRTYCPPGWLERNAA